MGMQQILNFIAQNVDIHGGISAKMRVKIQALLV